MVRALPTPPNQNRVLAYIRVSALMGRGGRDFHSPEVQIDGIRGLVSREGLTEVAVVDDDIDTSGQTMTRKGIARIRALVENGQVDILAVHTLSRIGRNLAEALTFIRWLRERGVRVISASEGFDETPEGQFQLGLWLNLAELQGKQIGAGWARIIARRAKVGRAHGRSAVGYLKKPDGDLVVDPDLGPAVTEMFAAYARGDPIAAITATFAAARHLPISRRTVKHMLGNALYHGRVIVRSKQAGDLDFPGVHPKLVDDDTWELVQARMFEDSRTPARRLTPTYALTGLLTCAHCGRALFVRTAKEKGAPVRRIFCGHADMTRGCDGIGRPLCDPIEDALLAEVVNFARYLRDDRPAARKPTGFRQRDATAVERELAGTRDAMARITERWARKAMPDSTYEVSMARLAATEQDQLAELRAVEAPAVTPAPAATLALTERLLALWPKMLPAERNFALKSVLRKATIRRAAFWHEPAADRITDIELRWPHGYVP
jgi:site-specific DNA recombinase